MYKKNFRGIKPGSNPSAKGMIFMNGRPVRSRKLSGSAERQLRERYARRAKMRRRRRIIFRSTMLFILVVLVICAILFLTPIFNIRSLNIEGNSRITTETLQGQLPDIVGENLFKVNDEMISEGLSGIAYVQDVQVNKKYFPAEVSVIITEKVPCTYVETGEGYNVLDAELSVLETTSEEPVGIARLTFYHESLEELKSDEAAMEEYKKFYSIASGIEIADKITSVQILEYNEINFEYEGKLKVICGSGIELEQKLRLFKAAVNNPGLSSNAHGTIDLSTAGKAMHTP